MKPASSGPARRPPGPKPRFPGEFLLARRDMLGLLQGLARDYGDAACLETGRGPLFFFNHPDAVREVLQTQSEHLVKSRALEFAKLVLGEGLLTSEDPLHRRQRALMQPAFHHKRVRSYAESMVHYALAMRANWKHGEVVDIHREMMALTLAIVGKTLFNTEVGSETAAVEGAMNAVMPLFGRAFLPWGKWLNRLPLPATRRFHRAKATLDATISRIMAEHKADWGAGAVATSGTAPRAGVIGRGVWRVCASPCRTQIRTDGPGVGARAGAALERDVVFAGVAARGQWGAQGTHA